MLDSTAPIPLDHQLPADTYWHLIHTLRLTLPPPPGDSPDDLRKRDHAAIACIAALAPGNAAEAKLAAGLSAPPSSRTIASGWPKRRRPHPNRRRNAAPRRSA